MEYELKLDDLLKSLTELGIDTDKLTIVEKSEKSVTIKADWTIISVPCPNKFNVWLIIWYGLLLFPGVIIGSSGSVDATKWILLSLIIFLLLSSRISGYTSSISPSFSAQGHLPSFHPLL